MKKRILSFVLLMLMVLTSFASAADLGYVMSEGDVSFTSVTFANDGTNVSASLKGIKAQGTDSVTLMMTVYNSKHKMVDASSDTKSVGTEAVELKATAPVPAGDFTLDATLFNTENGLSPIAAPAYSDYDGATDLLDLRVSGVTIDGFKPGVYEYGYITEGLTEYPEITATVREGSTKVTAAYEDAFPGVATITVANAKGATSVYKIDFTPLRHIVVGATSDADFTVDAGTNLNLVSRTAVSSGVGGKNLFTNLTGAPNDSLDFGSRWTTDYQPLGSHHAVRSVDPMLQGWDYFVCANGTMKKDAGNYFEFEVMHNARIVVVTLAAEPSLVANGFEALPSKLYAKASYVSGAASEDARKDLNALGITPTYADIEFYNANAKDHTALVNYFADKYNLNTDVASENIPVNRPIGVSVFNYQTAYSKFYEAYEDEPAKVIIPAPEATQGRGYIVAVIPVGEDGELPGSGNQGGGGETPDIPDVPDEPTSPLSELKSLVGGMTYSQYIDYVNSVVPANKAMVKETTVSETQKLNTTYNQLSTIAEDGKACSISAWRVFKNVADGWKGLTFMTTDPSHYQNDSARGWPMTMFSGKASSYSGDSCTGADNQIVPWWTIEVNKDMNVSIVSGKELTHLTDKGWTKLTIGTDIDNPFKVYDSRNGNPVSGENKYVYTKAFEKGDTVELYNENTGKVDYIPYIAVFDTPDVSGEGGDEPDTPVVPDEPVLAEGNHVIVGARYTDEIVEDADVTDGFKSDKAVTSAKTSRTDGIVYTNLRGTPDEAGTAYGARLCTMPANSTSYHEVYYADEAIAGNDYFVFTAGGNAHSDNPLLKFDIVADAEVYIITTNCGLAFQGYTLEENANGWIKGRFINRNMADAMNAIGVKPTYAVVKAYKPAEKDAFYNTYLKAAYDSADATAKAKFDEQWALFGTAAAIGNDSAYKAAYKATFTVPEGEDKVTVTVPGNTSGGSTRNILVVVKPIAEEEPDLSQDAEVLGVIAKIDAIGEVTLDSEDAILDAREAYDALSEEKKAYVINLSVLEAAEVALEELKAEAEQPVPVEGDHIIVGARMEGEIVADSGVTGGFKSAAAVTSAKTSRTDGVVYTNLRGTPDEAGTTYGARLCTMPANSTSYHEVYYADESLSGSDYFVFTAGGNAHSDATLLKFDVVADAEVSIIATHSGMAFDGFTLKENNAGWIKGRFINRNMADAMNAIGVTPVYSVVKTYKPAEKDAFYNTYLKAAYESANETQKAKFDEQWALFGTVAAIGNDSTYKAMYTKTFRLPEGEDTMTITVPGNTSGASSRNILVVVKTATGEEEVIPAEVTAVIELIDAIGEVTLDSEEAILHAREAYDALSGENQALVTNYADLEAAEATLEELKAAAEIEHVGALTSKVSGLTYAKYLEYIESVTGTKPTSTSVIKDTAVIATSTIVVRDSFTIGGQIGSESARRKLETINEDYAFLEGVKFFSPTIEWGQQADVRKWFTKLFWGQDATYTYDGFDYTVNAATDALPTVPWWTIPVTEATVYITSYVEMPHLEDAGWTKADTTDSVFTFKDTNNGAISNGPSVVYTKEVTDTETVELPNSNTGVHGTYPYFVFFVPNN